MNEYHDAFQKLLESSLAWIWLVALAVWGGTANYLSRIKRHQLGFSLIELIGEWAISGFAGVVTALVCTHLEWPFYLVAAAAGISGHMGGRAIGMMEQAVQSKFPPVK